MILIELSRRGPLARRHNSRGHALTQEGSLEGRSQAPPNDCGATRPARHSPALRPLARPNGSLVTRHSPIFTVFLTGTPKQLEIAVNHRKQDTEVAPNRDKNTTLAETNQDVRLGLACNRSAGGISGFRSPMGSAGVLGSDLPAIFRASTALEILWQHAAPRRTRSAFLIETRKRLETSATRRKQSSRASSNRYKITGSFAGAIGQISPPLTWRAHGPE